MRGEQSEETSKMKGSGLYRAKCGRNGITSSFVANRTSLILSYSMIIAEGGKASDFSKSVSLF